MPAIWKSIHSFLARISSRMNGKETRGTGPLIERDGGMVSSSRIAIVALVVSEHDRSVLTRVAGQEQWDLLIVESCAEAWAVMNQSIAPIILYDRNWPATEWRAVVQKLASSPHRACVVLTSGVVDDRLRQELTRCGGYEILVKPLREESVTRVVKLALSYWRSAAKPKVESINTASTRWR
jgi:response regulator RpfG family c-di-GMP phosphodiesterase